MLVKLPNKPSHQLLWVNQWVPLLLVHQLHKQLMNTKKR